MSYHGHRRSLLMLLIPNHYGSRVQAQLLHNAEVFVRRGSL